MLNFQNQPFNPSGHNADKYFYGYIHENIAYFGLIFVNTLVSPQEADSFKQITAFRQNLSRKCITSKYQVLLLAIFILYIYYSIEWEESRLWNYIFTNYFIIWKWDLVRSYKAFTWTSHTSMWYVNKHI